MINKIPLILAGLIFSSSLIFAQSGTLTEKLKNDLTTDWSLGVSFGLTQFDGDIRQYDYAPSEQAGLRYQDENFKELRSALSFSLERKIDERVSISVEHIVGEFAGLRRPNEYVGFEIDDPYGIIEVGQITEFPEGSGQKFLTSFQETDIVFNYDAKQDISKLIKTELPKNLSLIIKAGLGYNQFRSLRTNLYTDEYIYSYGYDELTKNESDDMVSESVIIYGAKIKYRFLDGLSLSLDYTCRNSNSDKWDSSLMDGGNGKDRFSFLSLGLAYDLNYIVANNKD